MEPLFQFFNNLFPFISGWPAWLAHTVVGVVTVLLLFMFIALFALFAIWLERKISAHMQDRLGPMEVGGWHGWAQTIADTIKLLVKEDIVPAMADRTLFKLAPVIAFTAALAGFAVLPWSQDFIPADLNVGLLYILSVSSFAVIGILMGGWASNNKWSLYGAMRSASQMISYEIPVALALLAVIMNAGTMSMRHLVIAQSGNILDWNVFNFFPLTAVAFFIYFIASLAEVNRTPFDLPEGESELVGGFHTEYSSMRFAFFFLGEYANMYIVAAIATTVFLGGWLPPFEALSFIPGPIWFVGKAMALVFIQMWLRWTLPRLRVDQLMYTCWKVLTPFSFAIILLIGLWKVL